MPDPEDQIGSEGTEGDPKVFDAEYVGVLRREAKDRRLAAKAAEAKVEELALKLKAIEDSEKSEVERLTTDRTRLEKELEDRSKAFNEFQISNEVRLEAAKMGLVDPEAAYLLVEKEGIELDDGRVKGVKKALEKLVKERAWLLGDKGKPEPLAPGTGGRPPATGGEVDNDPIGKAVRQLLKEKEIKL